MVSRIGSRLTRFKIFYDRFIQLSTIMMKLGSCVNSCLNKTTILTYTSLYPCKNYMRVCSERASNGLKCTSCTLESFCPCWQIPKKGGTLQNGLFWYLLRALFCCPKQRYLLRSVESVVSTCCPKQRSQDESTLSTDVSYRCICRDSQHMYLLRALFWAQIPNIRPF